MIDCLCFGWRKRRKYEKQDFHGFNDKCQSPKTPDINQQANELNPNVESKFNAPNGKDVSFNDHDKTRVFNYRELATATRNFHPDSFLGEGGFGSVYRGKLLDTDEVVAVKKLNPTGLQGEKEFLVEVLMLSLLDHPNLVNMIGYCAEGTQRLLVLDYMPLGSLEDHLHDLPPGKKPLDWNTRVKIAAGAAKGIDYLHNEAKPPVIFRDLKPSNILLDNDFHPKLSDFGLAKFGPVGDNSHVSTRVMGTRGYCAPEYALTGRLTAKTDAYSFGVVLLELITGHKAVDQDPNTGKTVCLVEWARPLLKDRKDHLQLVDPRLKGKFPKSALHKAIEVATMCLRENAHARPTMHEVSLAMDYLASLKYERRSCTLYLENLPKENKPQEDLPLDAKAREAAKISNLNFERELAIAEAKMWGEQWREKRQQQRIDCSLDGIGR